MKMRVIRAGSPEYLKVVGEASSPLSVESSFRELDDAFLQTQTRIWLGEVLHMRFDEETAIADLLADGELLFQVSKVVWKMLLKKYVELKHSKVYIHERTSFGKSDGRYMPYPKVDSFLKICQILELNGVDLFSSSDVVEKKNVRRVCMCIRSLSKKARSKNLNVPDFDIVTYTIAMPTDLVGGIRRNLEQSQCSSSSSNDWSSPSSMDLRETYRQKSPIRLTTQRYGSHSESDEAESSFTEFEIQSPSSTASSSVSNLCSITGESSPEGTSVGDGILSELETHFRLDNGKQNDADSSIPSSSTTSMEQTFLGIPNDPQVNRACYSMSFSDSAFIKNDHLSCGELGSLCDRWEAHCKNDSSTSTTISVDCSLPSVYDGRTIAEGSNADVLTCDLERSNADISTCDPNIDADKGQNHPVMSISPEDMTVNALPVGENKILKSTTSIRLGSQLIAHCCSSETESEKKMDSIQEQDASHHSCETCRDLLEEVRENYNENLCIQSSSHVEDSSDLQIEVLHTGCGSEHQMPLPVEDSTIDKVLLNLRSHQMDGIEISDLDNDDKKSSDFVKVQNEVLNVDDGIRSTNIHIVDLGTPSEAGSSEANFSTPDPVSKGRTHFEDNSIQTNEFLSSSASTCIMVREICAEKNIDVNIQSVLPLKIDSRTNTNNEKANGRKKGAEECKEVLVVSQDSSGKHKKRAKGNKVLKSVAGAVTLLGALFLFHHIRLKRDGEKDGETVVPKQTQKPRHAFTQKKSRDW